MLGPRTSFLPSNKDMIGREERKMGGRMERKVRMSHIEGNMCEGKIMAPLIIRSSTERMELAGS